jgi:hypothetical protein
VHGTIAGIGARLLQGTMRRKTEAFWTQFAGNCAATPSAD